MRLVGATYKGYINNHFIFTVNNTNVIFFPYEVTVLDMPLADLIRVMQKEIGSVYKLAIFWDTYGYYVLKNRHNTYDLHDALTNVNTGTTYETFESIPAKYMFKPIQKYQRKLLLAKVRTCSK